VRDRDRHHEDRGGQQAAQRGPGRVQHPVHNCPG
jgi:hypothetical protein